MPIHKGHMHLFREALKKADKVVVLIFWKSHEPIPGQLRVSWLKDTVSSISGNIRVVECCDEHPVDFNNPEIWDLWEQSIRKVCPECVDYVYSSEEYGNELARRMDAVHVCVDRERTTVPVSASRIRLQPWRYWDYISPPARPYFVRKVCIVGGESTGKTTLAQELASHYQTNACLEYARDFLIQHNNKLEYDDMLHIARTQWEREEILRQSANRFLICDTTALVTELWSNHYFNKCAPEIKDIGACYKCSFHLITAPDIPWVEDELRDTPHGRTCFYRQFLNVCAERKYPHAVITGSGADRLKNAISAIDGFFK